MCQPIFQAALNKNVENHVLCLQRNQGKGEKKSKTKQNKKTYIYLQQNMESTKTEYTQQEQKCISDLNLKLHLI